MAGSEFDPAASPLFTPRIDPGSGVTSYLLDAAPLRSARTFDCGHRVTTTDGRRLWVAGETNGGAVVAAIDTVSGTVRRVAPATGAAPAVDAGTGAAFVPVGRTVYRATSDGELRPEGRYGSPGSQLVAGVSVSAESERVLGVVERNGTWAVTSLYRPTGEVDVWHSGSRPYGSVLCSPADPTVAFLTGPTGTAAEPGGTGAAWLAREGLGARPLRGLLPGRHRCHWWSPEGRGLWYVAPGTGVGHLDLERSRSRTVWGDPRVRRAHATADGALIAATLDDEDQRLSVRDPAAGTTLDVASNVPAAGTAVNPQFVAGDRYLAYTTTAGDEPTLAVVSTDALREGL